MCVLLTEPVLISLIVTVNKDAIQRLRETHTHRHTTTTTSTIAAAVLSWTGNQAGVKRSSMHPL